MDHARDAFARLLMIHPDHKLSDYVSPRMRAPFAAAQGEHGEGRGLRAVENAPSIIYPGDPVTVELRLERDPLGMVDRYLIHYRLVPIAGDPAKKADATKADTEKATATESDAVQATPGSTKSGAATAMTAGTANATKPTQPQTAEAKAAPITRMSLDVDLTLQTPTGKIEYWCTLLDRHGGELAFLGSSEEPLAIKWEPKPDLGRLPEGQIVDVKDLKPIYKEWWFWAAVGTAAVVAGTALVVTLWPEGFDTPTYTHGKTLGGIIGNAEYR